MPTPLDALLRRARTYSAFADHGRHLATAEDLDALLAQAEAELAGGRARHLTIFDDATGDRSEFDAPGASEAVRRHLGQAPDLAARSGPGRPKLGVTSREVSLLPRHWEWLGLQPGGASAAIRRLVDEARARRPATDASRQAADALYKTISVLGGNLPNFEEASRALYAGDFERLTALTAGWEDGLAAHVARRAELAAALAALARSEAEEA